MKGINYYLQRSLNRRMNLREFRERRSVLSSYPYIAYIDPSNVCPLSCPLCPTGNRSSTHRKGLMTFETFRRIYDEVGKYLYELHLYNWGEPLLNRDIAEMVRYAKRIYNPQVIISTNLSGLSDERAEEIVRSGVDLLNVSIDGVSQETYEKYRVGGNLGQVLGTMRKMAEMRRAQGKKKPLIRWQFIPMKHNEGEIEAAGKMADEMGVHFRIHRVRLNICDFDKKETGQPGRESEEWMPSDPRHIRLKKKKGLENVCNFLWDRIVFNWDGSVFPCCKIYTAEDVFEKNFDRGFAAIWNSPAYVMAREIFQGKRAADGFICQRCVDSEGAF
jgi:MoaA/NifB/PqqE/SkfB family radical SAM enzyme